MTLPETLLWQRIRRKATGVSFRHQHPIGKYKADFYCAAFKLVIEVDGEIHNRGDRPTRDEERVRFLEADSYRVIRVSAADILRNPDHVAASIGVLVAGPPPPPRKRGGPPPRERGGAEQ